MFSTAPGKRPGLLRKLAGHRWVHHSLPLERERHSRFPGDLHEASDAVHPSGRDNPPPRQRLGREEFRCFREEVCVSVCVCEYPGGIFMGSAVGGIMITKGFSLALWPARASRGWDGDRRQSTIVEQMQATIKEPSTITSDWMQGSIKDDINQLSTDSFPMQ